MSSLHLNPVGGYALVLAVIVALVALLWIRPSQNQLDRRRRLALAGIRVGVILLVLLAMLRPTRVVSEIKKQSATLVILVDQSRSMQVTDVLGGRSRWQALRKVMDDAGPLLGDLNQETGLEIKVYAFDADVQPVPFTDDAVTLNDEANGEQSAIGAALEEVLRLEAGKRLVGVLLLSDGAQRAYAPNDQAPQTVVRRLADLGYPLHTFAFGQARGVDQARDVAIANLVANPTVFVKNQLDVTGSLRVNGYANQPIDVELLYETKPGEMEVIASTRLTAKADGRRLPVALQYAPATAGEYKLTLRAKALDGELVTGNNQLSTFVRVLKGGMRVLYLEGALRIEQRFLRSSLGASPNLQLDFRRFNHRSGTTLDLQDALEPGKYDVFILGDLDSIALKEKDWQRMADRVNEGAGLMMLGGFHSFAPGGYRDTPLADVLPIAMGRLERQNFDEPIRQDLHFTAPMAMRPTKPLGARHPVMALASGDANLRAWAELPKLDGANRFRGLKPGAIVLAEADDTGAAPLLVAGAWGGGRVLAFAGDTTWHWVLEDHEKQHKRFWRQAVLWLAHKDESTEGNVWIKLDQRRFRPEGRVAFTVGADTPEGDTVADATFEVEVIGPEGKRRPVQLTRDGETASGTFFETQLPGDYTIEVHADENDGEAGQGSLGTARARFLVFQQDLELDNPAADPGLLASLSTMTAEVGGQTLVAEELPRLLDELKKNPPELEVETQVKHTYWDTWPVMLLFAGLLGLEWMLRKRWGLV